MSAEQHKTSVKTHNPEFAIVIPVFKHSILMNEAIEAALREARNDNGLVVIVNDGCPFLETHEIALLYTCAYPQLVDYIRTINGGLSAARNRGVRHALSRFASIECVYLLDADNRLSAGAIKRARQVMRDQTADWVYPNIDKFGIEWSGDFSAPYNLFRHLFQNICEAGSLVHRRIFEAGLSFDEKMRKGYEDWDFWLQCADAGFRGRACEDFGFQYRQRRESMVRDSNRDDAEILLYMQRKHKRLFSWKNMLKLEHQDAPRYCIIDFKSGVWHQTSDLRDHGKQDTVDTIEVAYWLSVAYPVHFHFPNFIIVTDHDIVRELAAVHIQDWVFWQIEDCLQKCAFVIVQIEYGNDLVVSVEDRLSITDDELGAVHLVAMENKLLHECILDSDTSWVNSIRTAHIQPLVQLIKVKAPIRRTDVIAQQRGELNFFFDLFNRLRESPWRDHPQPWEWRKQDGGMISSKDLFRKTREHMRAFAPLACHSAIGSNEIVFVLPVLSFGGVEQVAEQVAREFRSRGWRTRAIVTESNEVHSPRRLFDAFDSLAFLNDKVALAWSPSGEKYYGHALQTWETHGRVDRLMGLITGCVAVINFQSQNANGVMGWLRKNGVITATSLHLFDRDGLNAPVGHPYLMLAYEHAYDIITSPSVRLMHALSALGVPSQKLVHLPNAPTFKISDVERGRRLYQIATGSVGPNGRPLRIISIGRLDGQKGIERLEAVIRASKHHALSVEWRIIGSAVIAGSASREVELSGITIERPVYSREEVKELLSWADAVILLSHWEGSPLIILEAQSLGVIPIVTDVGGVSELVEDGVDGVIVLSTNLTNTIKSTIETVGRLISDESWRIRLGTNACAKQTSASWAVSIKELADRVISEVATRNL